MTRLSVFALGHTQVNISDVEYTKWGTRTNLPHCFEDQ